MYRILKPGLAKEMIEQACKIVLEKGIATRNTTLLEKAGRNGMLAVRNGRIYPSREIFESCLGQLKNNKVPQGDSSGNHHGWPDMLINKGEDSDVVIRITDLPYQYCNHESHRIVPLTRQQVIEGTKLLHVLSESQNIRGYSCGVPQDTHACLKAIEQYLIGFRYNRNGGGTIQSIAREAEADFSRIRAIAEELEHPDQRELMLFSPSPLMLDTDDLWMCFRKDVMITRFMTGSMPMMGMTGPVNPVGIYILSLAEVLGAASILHALLPFAQAYVYPHPQAMSLQTGQMAFGTVEHARLEMMKIGIMDALGLPYYNVKDIMTSAQMPGAMAQGDKALGFFTGIMAGYRAFNLMPLSTDQVWSPVQALLDIKNLQNAWKVMEPVGAEGRAQESARLIEEVLNAKSLFAENADTLLHMHDHYDVETLHRRFFTSESWAEAGRPEELVAVEEKRKELLAEWDYRPPQEKLGKVIDLYRKLCKKCNTEPLPLE